MTTVTPEQIETLRQSSEILGAVAARAARMEELEAHIGTLSDTIGRRDATIKRLLGHNDNQYETIGTLRKENETLARQVPPVPDDGSAMEKVARAICDDPEGVGVSFFKQVSGSASRDDAFDPPEPRSLRDKIRHAINCVSAENGSDTPDHVLADYLMDSLKAFDAATNIRNRWLARGKSETGAIQTVKNIGTGELTYVPIAVDDLPRVSEPPE